MLHADIRIALGLSALAVGLATSAFGQVAPPGPYQFYSENPAPNKGNLAGGQQYDLDFTKKSLDPAIDYPTFPNPKAPQNIVKYQDHFFAANVGLGACFEIASSGPAGSDLVVSAQNQAGTHVWLADDNNGNGQFRLRFFIKAGAQYHVRVHEYSSPNNNNRDGIIVRKFNLDPGAAITATSCRAAGVPYWQFDLNGGNPYNPS
jgi:hypothetical protein